MKIVKRLSLMLAILLVCMITTGATLADVKVDTVGYGITVTAKEEMSVITLPDGTQVFNDTSAYYTAPGNGDYVFGFMDKKGITTSKKVTLNADCMTSFDTDGDGKHDTVVEVKAQYSSAEIKARTTLNKEMILAFPASYGYDANNVINDQQIVRFSKAAGMAYLQKEGSMPFYIKEGGEIFEGTLVFSFKGVVPKDNTTTPSITTPKEEVVKEESVPQKEVPVKEAGKLVTPKEDTNVLIVKLPNENSKLDGNLIVNALLAGKVVKIELTEQNQSMTWSLDKEGVPEKYLAAHKGNMEKLIDFIRTNPSVKEVNDYIISQVLDTVDRVATVGQQQSNPYTGGSTKV